MRTSLHCTQFSSSSKRQGMCVAKYAMDSFDAIEFDPNPPYADPNPVQSVAQAQNPN